MRALEKYFRELLDGKRCSVPDRLLFSLLKVLSHPYNQIVRIRAAAYACGILPSRGLPRPVISVGNLTVGGTGKTPAVAMLARYFLVRGKRVTVLSRGYGGTLKGKVAIVSDGSTVFLNAEEAGDEPCLLASTVPGLAVVVGGDRYHAGLLAMERLAPDVFILDDGFQHLRLKRDFNVLLLDSSRPFGNGRTLPAGILREPPSAAERADFVIYTRCSGGEERPFIPGKPSCRAFHHLVGVTPLGGGKAHPFSTLSGMRGVAFAGIADPAAFFTDLEEEGLTLAAVLPFPDHCRYGDAEIALILGACASCGADYVITTEKDGIKLAPYRKRLGVTYTAGLEMWVADPGPLKNQLEKIP